MCWVKKRGSVGGGWWSADAEIWKAQLENCFRIQKPKREVFLTLFFAPTREIVSEINFFFLSSARFIYCLWYLSACWRRAEMNKTNPQLVVFPMVGRRAKLWRPSALYVRHKNTQNNYRTRKLLCHFQFSQSLTVVFNINSHYIMLHSEREERLNLKYWKLFFITFFHFSLFSENNFTWILTIAALTTTKKMFSRDSLS